MISGRLYLYQTEYLQDAACEYGTSKDAVLNLVLRLRYGHGHYDRIRMNTYPRHKFNVGDQTQNGMKFLG